MMTDMLVTRRAFLVGGTAASIVCPYSYYCLADSISLKAQAERNGILYGCAVQSRHLHDPLYARAVAQEAGIIVPEGELKRGTIQPNRDRYNFEYASRISTFADRHGLMMRGHTLVWHAALPAWLTESLKTGRDERILTDYIDVVGRYFRGRVHSWDVVNEAIEPRDGDPNGLRRTSPWYSAFGHSYIETAFHAARLADPTALLFYNDFGVEAANRTHELRRAALLRLCERLRAKGVPIDGVGIQGHLVAFRDVFNEEIFARFLKDIAALGLKVMITEFDIADIGGPTDIVKRDAEVASLGRRFLDVALDCRETIGVITWGISDRYSWLSDPVWGRGYVWPDGQLSRGLPLDENFRRKPLWYAVREAFAAARRAP